MLVRLVKTTYQYTNALTNAINAGSAVVTKLSAAKIMLGTGTFIPGPATTFADLAEATFTGYAESTTVVWGLPINEADGSVSSQSPSKLFRCTASGISNNITGIGVTDGVAPTSTGILASGLINPSIPIANSGDGFSVIVNWNEGLNPDNCAAVIIQ